MIFSGLLQRCRLRHDFTPQWSQDQLLVCISNEENVEDDRSSSHHHLSIDHQFSCSQIPPTKNSGRKGRASCLRSAYTGISGGKGEYRLHAGARLLAVTTVAEAPQEFHLFLQTVPCNNTQDLLHLLCARYHFKHFLYLILIRIELLTNLS